MRVAFLSLVASTMLPRAWAMPVVGEGNPYRSAFMQVGASVRDSAASLGNTVDRAERSWKRPPPAGKDAMEDRFALADSLWSTAMLSESDRAGASGSMMAEESMVPPEWLPPSIVPSRETQRVQEPPQVGTTTTTTTGSWGDIWNAATDDEESDGLGLEKLLQEFAGESPTMHQDILDLQRSMDSPRTPSRWILDPELNDSPYSTTTQQKLRSYQNSPLSRPATAARSSPPPPPLVWRELPPVKTHLPAGQNPNQVHSDELPDYFDERHPHISNTRFDRALQIYEEMRTARATVEPAAKRPKSKDSLPPGQEYASAMPVMGSIPPAQVADLYGEDSQMPTWEQLNAAAGTAYAELLKQMKQSLPQPQYNAPFPGGLYGKPQQRTGTKRLLENDERFVNVPPQQQHPQHPAVVMGYPVVYPPIPQPLQQPLRQMYPPKLRIKAQSHSSGVPNK